MGGPHAAPSLGGAAGLPQGARPGDRGAPDVGSFSSRFFRSRGLRAGFSAARALARPSTLKRAMETAYYDGDQHRITAELLSMSVALPYRGRGIGKQLAARLIRAFTDDGVDQVKVVVAIDNEKARALYSSVGFVDLETIEVHSGEQSMVMVRLQPS